VKGPGRQKGPGKLSLRPENLRGGLVFKADRLVYHSTLGSSVIKKKKKKNLRHATPPLDQNTVRRLTTAHLLSKKMWSVRAEDAPAVWGGRVRIRVRVLPTTLRYSLP